MKRKGRPRVGAIVFTVTAALLFGTSAVYHRGHWSARAALLLKRLDHSNIFLIIAGSYTPFALAALQRGEGGGTLAAVVPSANITSVQLSFSIGRSDARPTDETPETAAILSAISSYARSAATSRRSSTARRLRNARKPRSMHSSLTAPRTNGKASAGC